MSPRRSSAKPKSAPRVEQQAVPIPPPRQRNPAWTHQSAACVQHTSSSIQQILGDLSHGIYSLPVFQRPYVWRDEQVLSLLDSLVQGYHVGSLIVWERHGQPASGSMFAGISFPPLSEAHGWHFALVVDGQQRLGAIAQAFFSGRFAYDCAARQFVVDQPERSDLLPLSWLYDEAYDQDRVRTWRQATPDGTDKCIFLREALLWRTISCVVLPERWPLEKVIESYRRIATMGTPIDPDHLREGLARAMQGP